MSAPEKPESGIFDGEIVGYYPAASMAEAMQLYGLATELDTLRAECDALAARVERLTALIERAYCEGFEYALRMEPDSEWGGGNQWPDSEAKRELTALSTDAQ
jgi:hypothetical protein